jgi:flagellar protein FlaG
MDFNIPPISGGVERTDPAPRGAPVQEAGFSSQLDAAVNVSTLPASPPTSVLEDMHAAARVAEELRAQKRELHFETTSNGRVIVQVRDLDGNVIRTIPPARALEIASGAPLDG